jgi:hypothetical protein
MEGYICASIFDGTQSPVEEICLRRTTAVGLFSNVGEMQAIVTHSICGITLMSSSIELTSSGLGYHQAQTPSFTKQTKKKGLK